jgi:S-(hydroxymethyl)glutathione dehydrogenase / alcohol dehydrogenase
MVTGIQKTTAAILVSSNQQLEVDEVSLPSRLLVGQVLVEVITAGICGAQINEIDAVKGIDHFLPHLLGHEGYAEVLEIGPGVTNVKVGQKVIMHWRKSQGIQAAPAEYTWRNKKLNAGWVTTFNRHSIVSENRLTAIPETRIDQQILPLLGCALTTAFGVVEKEAQLTYGDSIIVYGCGGVGLLVIKLAKLRGVRSIIAVDVDENKLALASKFGADRVIRYINLEETKSALREVSPNDVSVAIETTGTGSGIEICFDAVAEEGRVVIVGVPHHKTQIRIPALALHFGKTFLGSKGGQTVPEKDIPVILKMLESGQLDLSDYPIEEKNIEDINLQIEKVRNGSAGRKIILFNSI